MPTWTIRRFGAAVIGRILEAEGLRVAIVPQPNWRDDLRDFRNWDAPSVFRHQSRLHGFDGQ